MENFMSIHMPPLKILSLTFQFISFYALDQQAKQFATAHESIYIILSHFFVQVDKLDILL